MKNGLGVSLGIARSLTRYEIPHKVVTAVQSQGAVSAWQDHFLEVRRNGKRSGF
jgi:hypothetical protein